MSGNSIMDRFRNLESRTRLYWLVGIAAVIITALIVVEANRRTEQLERKRTAKEKELAEMMSLSARHKAAKTGASRLTGRIGAVHPDDSVARIVEEIGIKGKSLQIRPLKGEDKQGMVEDLAEVRIEAITLNEMVNLIYRLEKGTKPVTIRKATMKARFDDPSRVDVVITAALLKPAPTAR